MHWLKTTLLWPLHLAGLATGQKDFMANPVLGSKTLNGWGLHVLRKRAAHALCQWRRHGMESRLPVAWVRAYQTDGCVVLPDFLPATECEQLKLDVARLQQTAIEMVQRPATTRRFNLDRDTCAPYPALAKLLDNAPLFDLLRYAAGYGGAPIVAVQCIHTDADGEWHDPQTDWHADTFHSTAKAWLFLHDVAADEGPFAYVPGSHALTGKRLAWEQEQSIGAPTHVNRLHAKGSFRATEAELGAMGYGEPVLGVVRSNTLVVADTSGFHRRTPSPQATVRVEVYLSLRRNPYLAGLYPSLLGLPGLKRRWAEVALNVYRWQQRKGIASWHPAPVPALSDIERERLGLKP